jgi:carboxyl-terminal processing protease
VAALIVFDMLEFMKKKIVIPVVVLLILAVFFSFKYRVTQSSEERRQLVVATVLKTIEAGHFSPRPINDSFSVRVYQKIVGQLDYEKLFFTQEDIDRLEKYKFKIDDEIRLNSLEFFDTLDAIYQRRTVNAEQYYKQILNGTFTFDGNETIQLIADKEPYAKNNEELKNRWLIHLKYRVLTKYVDLKSEQEKKYKDSVNVKVKPDTALVNQARDDIKRFYERWFKRINKWKDDDRFALYVNAIANNEDPHTEYFPPVEKKDFDVMMSGSFFGIGAKLRQESDKTIVAEIVTGSPSWKQGDLKAGDEISKVAQGDNPPVDIAGLEIDEVVKLIRGDKNTEVRLTVKKADGTTKVIPIMRGVVSLEETFAKSTIIKSKIGKIGYIYLPEFYADFNHTSGRRCAIDIEIEVKKLMGEGVEGMILDLRNNSGGSLGDVVDMAGVFVGRNAVVQVKNNHEAPRTLHAQAADTAVYKGPFVVMVNENSASASEILAAAMQDYKRAVIVGTGTYGKGTVQKMVGLDDVLDPFSRMKLNSDTGSEGVSIGSIKMTMEKFYRVNGGSTQLKGVTPDIFLPDINDFEDEDMGERHNKSALPWDEIAPSKYRPVNSIPNMGQLVKYSRNRVEKNATFRLIEENARYIKDKKDNNIVSLNEKLYKKDLEEAEKMSKKWEELNKVSLDMEIENPTADLQKINIDSATIAKNKDWLKRLGKDVHLAETVNIVSDLYKQTQK